MNLEAIYTITNSLNQFLKPDSIKESDLNSIKYRIDGLFRLLPLPLYNCIPARLERLTINESIPDLGEKRVDQIEHLRNPPTNSVKKYGRCNTLNHSVLYGAFNFLTIVNELTPDVGKLITHAEWRLKEEASLRFFPVFFITQIDDDPHNGLSLEIKELHENYISSYTENDKQCFNLSMQFFAECFAKKVDKSNHFDYFLSAYISKKIFEIESLNYEGILYPSTGMDLGFSNMALRPEVFRDKFKLIEVRYELNSISPGKSGGNHVINRSTKFDLEKDLIIWEE
jgi:hypothetical protein